MRKKVLVVILSLMLAGLTMAQEKIFKVGYGTRSEITDEEAYEFPLDIAAKTTAAKVVVLFATVWAIKTGSDTAEIMPVIDMSAVQEIQFTVDFSAVKNTSTRFHFIITGPETLIYTTDDYYTVKKNSADYVYLASTEPWKPGVYKVLMVAEEKSPGSAAAAVAQCTIIIY